MGVMHNVLKRENYLLSSNDADTMLKATDFGLTAFIEEGALDFHIDPWPSISDNSNDLVGQMLPQDMKQRMTSTMIIEHPWLQWGEASIKTIDSVVLAIMQQFRTIKLICINYAHRMAYEIINFLNSGDVILVKRSNRRQLGLTLALLNFYSENRDSSETLTEI
ncbi:hypothetical protein RND71_036675 [Anisodus tanguticus]|uniref:Protein kinase domain-containing protein n=1 Tax=Anisodus tanguticus TaxID=243964 RepID=A0AAE1R278_9SOLA|nr:hypothetical protein RND71_036675 [Anisodus tanguticus]